MSDLFMDIVEGLDLIEELQKSKYKVTPVKITIELLSSDFERVTKEKAIEKAMFFYRYMERKDLSITRSWISEIHGYVKCEWGNDMVYGASEIKDGSVELQATCEIRLSNGSYRDGKEIVIYTSFYEDLCTRDIIVPQIEDVEKRILVKGTKKPIEKEIKKEEIFDIVAMSKEDFIALLKDSEMYINEEEFDEDIEEDKLYSELYSDYLKAVEEYNLHKKCDVQVEHEYGEVNIFSFKNGKVKYIHICGDYGCVTYMYIKLK